MAHTDTLPTVLIADLDGPARTTLQRMLAGHCHVTVADTGAQALACVREARPDCVLLADHLPGTGSLALLQQLGARSPRHPMAVVMLAHRPDTAGAVRALKGGANDYLPFEGLDAHRLLHAIRNALHNVALRRELAAQRRELDRQREWLSVTLASVGDAVITTGTDGRIASINPVGEQMTGWNRSAAIGRPVAEVVRLRGAQDREPLPDPIAAVLEADRGTGVAVDALLERRDGPMAEVAYSASPIRDRDGRQLGAVLAFHDVCEARALALKMSRIAQHDFLTELPNRMLLIDRANQAIRVAQRHHTRVALLFVDLDRFKQVNDTLGHEVGDELLRLVARRLSATVRRSDTVGRHGGDEFVVLLPDLEQAQDAADIAAKLLAAGAAPYRIRGHDVRVSFSIGIALYPDDGDSVDALMRHADLAMYEAKDEGRHAFRFFDHDRNIRATQRMSLESGLRRGLRQGEFELHYQAKLSLDDGRVTGSEALIRWRRPGGDLVPPADFIPTAEDSGLIVPIGLWAAHEACRQSRCWAEQGAMRLPVAVNISATQFHRQDFVGDVTRILADTGWPANLLELELTETTLMRDVEATIDELAALRAMGVRIAIDDFGTGYCGLAYLKKLPVDTLKIDQSFVRDVPQGPTDAEIVATIVRLGRTLAREVVAEGVENPAQAGFLRRQRCDGVQGYLFGRPVPAAAFPRFVAERHSGLMMSTI